MKRTFRLTALIMALLMLVNISALATTEGYPVSGVDMAFYNQILQSASQAAQQNTDTADEEAYHWGYLSNSASFNGEAAFGSSLGSVPAGSLVKVYLFDSANSVYKIEYNGQIGYISGTFLTQCKCTEASVTDPATHGNDCIYPKYFNELANSKTADELYSMWSTFTTGEQAYLLIVLQQMDLDKYTALDALLNPPVVQPDKEATTEDGTKVTVKGDNIPADVTLNLSTVTDSAILDSVLPGFDFQRASYFALDVSLWQNGAEWQPANSDTLSVTISVNENVGKPGDYIELYHKHGSEQTSELGLYSIANDGTITFDMDRFSFVFGVNISLCHADCWFNELKDLPTATDRYEYLLGKRDPITEYDTFMYHYRVTHSASNLVCICQYESVFKYVDSIYAPGDPIHKADCPWAFKNLTVEEQAALLGQGSATTANGSISGVMPAGAVGVMDSITANEDLVNALIPADMFAEGTMTTKAFDIKLNDANGNAWMPTAPVTVQVKGIVSEDLEDPLVAVIHLLDSAEAIAKEGSNVFTIDDPAIVAVFSEEAAAAQEAGLGDVVAYTVLTNLNEGVTVNADGSISFETNSFSNFYVVTGNVVESAFGNHTYYVYPGANLRFDENPDGLQISIGGGNDEYVTITQTNNSVDVVIHADSPIGYDITMTYTVEGRYWDTTYRTTIKVLTLEQVVEQSLGNNVYLTFVHEPVKGIPTEPSVDPYKGSGKYRCVVKSGSGYAYDYWSAYGTASSVINSDIGASINFVASVDGSNTAGVYDATGALVKSVLKFDEADWDAIKATIIDAGYANALDESGELVKVTRENADKYVLVPYVVKMQGGDADTASQNKDWHIDCCFVLAETLTLSYNINIPGTNVLAGYSMPLAQSVQKDKEATVGQITKNNSNSGHIVENSVVTVVSGGVSYEYTFKGWNTKADGTGTTYQPNHTIKLTEDTTLYAMWETARLDGEFTLSKSVKAPSGVTIPDDLNPAYVFTVTYVPSQNVTAATDYNWQNAGYEYRLFTNGLESSKGTIKFTQNQNQYQMAITLYANQQINISNMPTGTYTVSETPVDQFTSNWTNNTATKVLAGGALVNFECVNTYEPATGSLTIKKTVDDKKFNGGSFSFAITPLDGQELPAGVTSPVAITIPPDSTTGSVELNDLPAGSYTVTEMNAEEYETKATVGNITTSGKAVTIEVPAGGEEEVGFTNTRKYGDLVISKTVTGANAPDEVFTFTVVLGNAGSNYSYAYEGANGARNGNITANANTIELKHGQSVTIKDLPYGATYTVTESATWTDGFNITEAQQPAPATGSIGDATATAAFTNTYNPGTLKITKKVTNDPAFNGGKFSFEVTKPDGTTKKVEVTIPDGQSEAFVTLADLRVGNYVVTELNAEDYDTTVTGGTSSNNGKTVTAAVSAAGEGEVVFTNARKEGDLVISKTVTGANAPDEVFTFTVVLGNAGSNYSYAYEGANGVANGTITANANTIELKNGQSVTIKDLPYGATYTVTESATWTEGFNITEAQKPAPATGSIGDATATAAFTNTYNPGTLKITKKVTNDPAFNGGEFSFEVTKPDSTKETVKVTIPAGQTEGFVTLADLRVGNYIVTELGAEDYDTTVTGGTASNNGKTVTVAVPAAGEGGVVFTNARKQGNLKISKTVQGEYAPKATFTFEVVLTDAGNIAYPYKVYDAANNTEVKAGTIGGTLNTLELKDGQYALITGLPQGAQYSVEEINIPDGFKAEPALASGNISAAAEAVAAFTNIHQVGSLTITKTADPNTDGYFVFQIKQDSTEVMKVYIQGSGSTTISNLPAGNYTVTELDSAWRYKLAQGETKDKSVTVETGKTATVEYSNVHETDKWLDDETLKDNKFN